MIPIRVTARGGNKVVCIIFWAVGSEIGISFRRQLFRVRRAVSSQGVSPLHDELATIEAVTTRCFFDGSFKIGNMGR
jgi:hypothetical protein